MSQRKILFILPTVKTFTGGERVNVRLLEIAKNMRPETELFELGLLEDKAPEWLKNLFAIRYLGRVFKMIYLLAVCPKLYKSICFTDYYSINDLFLYLLISRALFRSINLCYFHQISSDLDELKTPGKIKALRHMISFLVFDLVLVNSRFNKKQVMSLGVPEKRIKVLYPLLIDKPGGQKEKDNKKDNGLLHLLFVGGNCGRKGLLYAIQAIKRLNRRDLRLDIVGDLNKEKRYSDYLINFVNDNNLHDLIKFRGRVDKETLESYWKNADIFLFPTLFEGFGIALAEAMSYQLPIISTNVSAIPELVKDGENGILVPPEDPDSLARAIEKLADNSYLRKKMGKNGYRKINRFYESYSIDSEFRNILEGLM